MPRKVTAETKAPAVVAPNAKVVHPSELWLTLDPENKIRVGIKEWKGKKSFDVRIHVDSEGYTGFTKQGVQLPLERLYEFVVAVTRVYTHAVDNGLVEVKEEAGK